VLGDRRVVLKAAVIFVAARERVATHALFRFAGGARGMVSTGLTRSFVVAHVTVDAEFFVRDHAESLFGSGGAIVGTTEVLANARGSNSTWSTWMPHEVESIYHAK